ncbi:TIGR02117 family protein [Hymenobacter rubripertinctus]|uniref:TIGR02117 family protein n=1 Tax=Hymenobacter rubripertinctus TaxID=2029981 RepID=A0A418QX36_9BACT|nr:TIGR02117 family protein [Hymenobacter rubripertinctus]RIY09740.1 TIGR02117 family protein [Hymenobacter rubripertinctus]
MAVFVAFILLLMTGTLVPANRQFRQTPGGVPVYLVSNGLHTDVLVPLREAQTGQDWLRELGQPALTARFGRARFVAFGWGNERFYLGSMGGKIPGPGAVAGALLPSRTLLHVRFYPAAPDSGRYVVPLRISAGQYERLTQYIRASFAAPDSVGGRPLRQAAGYSSHDFFFRATGRYHALRTCNDWTNQGLHRAGLRAALKTPLAAPVLFQARRTPPPPAPEN